MRTRAAIAITALAVVVSACGSGVSMDRYEVPEAGISIEYPRAWQAVTDGGATLFAETEDAVRAAYEPDPPPVRDLSIVFDHRDLEFMRSIGFAADPVTPQSLLDFNSGNFGWESIGETRQIEILDMDAVAVRVATPIGVSEVIQGFLPGAEEIFLLQVSGRDEAALDDFDALWQEIIASIASMD